MSEEYDAQVHDLVVKMIPVVKKRITRAVERSREDVEYELVTLASLFIARDALERAS